MNIEYYRGTPIMYNCIKGKYYIYEGEYTKSKARHFLTFEDACDYIDKLNQ